MTGRLPSGPARDAMYAQLGDTGDLGPVPADYAELVLGPRAQWDPHLAQRGAQARRAAWYIRDRLRQDGAQVTARAAVILRAPRDAPELEQALGARHATHLEGQGVKCRGCKRKYTCQPEDPYFGATTAANGLCNACLLADSRPDNAIRVMEGVVHPPKKRRQA